MSAAILRLVPRTEHADSTIILTIGADDRISHKIDVLDAHIEIVIDALLILTRKIRSESCAPRSAVKLTEVHHG